MSALVLALSLFFAFGVSAQTSPSAGTDSLFQQAVAFDANGKSTKAVTILSRIVKDQPNIDIYCFAYARALYHTNTLGEAKQQFERFTTTFPFSTSQKEAFFFLGNIAVQLNNLTDATTQYLRAYNLCVRDKSSSTQFVQLLDSSLTALFRRATAVYPNRAEFDAIPSDVAYKLVNRLAVIRQEVGDKAGSECLLNLYFRPHPPPVTVSNNSVKVAMVLPFSGDNAEFAERVFNGANIAVAKTDGCAHPIQLIPFDTEGDKIIAARLIQKIAQDSSFVAAIGPLTSDESAVSAAALNHAELPLIVPAASDAGFTEFSASVFQLTPNIGVQTARIAAYAKEQLRADTAIILTADDAVHHQMASLFAQHFVEGGGIVLTQLFYAPGEKDFKPYIGDIKNTLRRQDSDSLAYVNETGDTLDPDERPVTLDCIYMPGEPEQIRLLLPQLRFYNLNAMYLGSDEWADPTIYGLGETVVRDAVFPSAHLQTSETEEGVQFASNYLAQYQVKPERLAKLGYDAVRCICMGTQAEKPERAALRTALAGLHDYVGLSGAITFSKTRVNIALPLYRIHNGQPIIAEEHLVASPPDSSGE